MSTTSKKQKTPIATSSGPKLPPQAHAAFTQFQAAKERLSAFHARNEKIMKEYGERVGDYNRARDDAEAAFTEHHKLLGGKYMGFSVSPRRKINAELLVQLMPDAYAFVKEEPKLTCAEYDKHASLIPHEIQEQVVVWEDTIKGPKKL